MRRLSVAQYFALASGLLVAVGVASLIVALITLDNLTEARTRLIDRLQPAVVAALRLDTALIDQESGVRGFVLTGEAAFLEPYRRGVAAEPADRIQILNLTRGLGLSDEVRAAARAARAWQRQYAEPTIETVRRGFQPGDAEARRGMRLFGAQRRASARLQEALEAERRRLRADLDDSADEVKVVIDVAAGVLLLTLIGSGVLLRQVVVQPLRRLASLVRGVAAGDFGRRVEAGGAREVRQVADDADEMRRQIVAERDDLARSNAELEQFAYVASHDLQEPLRKVASFTQMLQRRYQGQLDERADTYIEFAVDGATRMQELINDLLAFSRVGRLTEEQVVLDANGLVDQAVAALGEMIRETGATVDVGELPPVRGEPALLALVFQNLIGNAIKFRGEAAPHIRVRAERHGADWHFTVADNGIGIESEYADRIFVIFQRLHPRTAYEGTGIGLAMCRKVIEHHGGRIWLGTETDSGSTFHFTLPAIEEQH